MANIALLAAVPEEHLVSGLEILSKEEKVAFGSSAWEVFRQLEDSTVGAEVDVFIYPSGSAKQGQPKVRWRAKYLRTIDSINGAHPVGMRFRPTSTEKYATDNQGHWAVFWEVTELTELAKEDALKMSIFVIASSGKPLFSSYIPRGPILVHAP